MITATMRMVPRMPPIYIRVSDLQNQIIRHSLSARLSALPNGYGFAREILYRRLSAIAQNAASASAALTANRRPGRSANSSAATGRLCPIFPHRVAEHALPKKASHHFRAKSPTGAEVPSLEIARISLACLEEDGLVPSIGP
jgi:hypothetical protein